MFPDENRLWELPHQLRTNVDGRLVANHGPFAHKDQALVAHLVHEQRMPLCLLRQGPLGQPVGECHLPPEGGFLGTAALPVSPEVATCHFMVGFWGLPRYQSPQRWSRKRE